MCNPRPPAPASAPWPSPTVSYEDDDTAADLWNGVITDPLAGRGDTDPYSSTGSDRLGARGVWEVAARYETWTTA